MLTTGCRGAHPIVCARPDEAGSVAATTTAAEPTINILRSVPEGCVASAASGVGGTTQAATQTAATLPGVDEVPPTAGFGADRAAAGLGACGI